jgi:hypothetical protein
MDNDSTGQESNNSDDGASSDNDGASSNNDGASSNNDGASSNNDGASSIKDGSPTKADVNKPGVHFEGITKPGGQETHTFGTDYTKENTAPASPNDSSNHTNKGDTTSARPNDSSNHTKENTTPASPNDSSNHNKEDTKPARSNDSKEAPRNKPENQDSTSGTTENKDQQKSSSQASGNSTNVRDWLSKEYNSVKEWPHELVDSEKPEKISVDKAVKVTPAPEKKLFTNTPGYDVDKATTFLTQKYKPKPKTGTGKCATYVREALEQGHVDTKKGRPVSAKDYGSFLKSKGFTAIPSADYQQKNRKKGDIVVIDAVMETEGASKNHKDGHIAMFNGTIWMSDFEQQDFWGGPDYRKVKPKHTFYRWP